MNGKIIGILFVAIVIIAVIYAAGFYSTNFSLEKDYYNYYNSVYAGCMQNEKFIPDSNADPNTNAIYSKCISQEGCFEPCTSACSKRPIKSIGFSDLIPYYFDKASGSSTMCIAVCVPKCFYPSSSQYFGS